MKTDYAKIANQSKYMEMLRPWFIPVKQIFQKYNKYVLDAVDNESHRVFIDRDSLVLFVAHLDTVRTPKLQKSNAKYIRGRGFDDRLGCMLAYNLSKELNADLLLTDHEENGGTTAKYHKTKDYNWIVEFDRESTDVVTYDLDSPEFRDALKDFWPIGFGSYSDICDIKTDACCFNLGLGHYNSHGKKSFIKIKEMERQIIKFKEFYALNKDAKYIKTKQEYDFTYDDVKYARMLDQYNFTDGAICEFCGWQHGVKVFGTVICSDCFEMFVENQYYVDNF